MKRLMMPVIRDLSRVPGPRSAATADVVVNARVVTKVTAKTLFLTDCIDPPYSQLVIMTAIVWEGALVMECRGDSERLGERRHECALGLAR